MSPIKRRQRKAGSKTADKKTAFGPPNGEVSLKADVRRSAVRDRAQSRKSRIKRKDKQMAKMTIKQLEEDYSGLIEEIKEKAVAQFAAELNDAPLEKIAEKLPDFYEKLKARAMEMSAVRPAKLNVDGFLLDTKDPFAAGTASTWAKSKKTDVPGLPMVLPYADKDATIAALRNYIIRATGADDGARMKKAVDALKKLGVDIEAEKKAKQEQAKQKQTPIK